jgi:hypothetical protein
VLERLFPKTSSDHYPVLITLTAHALNREKQPSLSNRHTNWDFRHLTNERLTLNVFLKTERDTEAAVKFSYGNNAMDRLKCNTRAYTHKAHYCPILIKKNYRDWHQLRTPGSKRLLNTATQELKELLNNNKNDCIQTFLQGLTPADCTDYSLRKETKKIKTIKKLLHRLRHHKELRQEVVSGKDTLSRTLSRSFQPHPSENEPEEEGALICYDLSTGKVLEELSIIGIKYLTQLFSAVLLTEYLPALWGVHTDHPHLEARETYQPISLLLVVSNVFDNLNKPEGRLEYFRHSPVSRKRHLKGDTVPRGITGPSCS